MKRQPDGTFIFTARSGNQCVLTPTASADGKTIVVDAAWNRPEKPSDRRECDNWFAKNFSASFAKIDSVGGLTESQRRELAAHALTHGSLPSWMEAEHVKVKK